MVIKRLLKDIVLVVFILIGKINCITIFLLNVPQLFTFQMICTYMMVNTVSSLIVLLEDTVWAYVKNDRLQSV